MGCRAGRTGLVIWGPLQWAEQGRVGIRCSKLAKCIKCSQRPKGNAYLVDIMLLLASKAKWGGSQ